MKMYRKILVIRFGSIGDIVLTTPVFSALKNVFPKAEIHFLTKKTFISITENNPNIDKIIAYEGNISTCAKELNSEHYDLVIDLHSNLKTLVLYWLMKPDIRWLTYSKNTLKKWAWVLLGKKSPIQHVTQQYMNTLSPFGIDQKASLMELYLRQDEIQFGKKVPFTHLAGYAVFAIGATHFTKKMPIQKWEELCRNIQLPVIIIGGENEKIEGEKLALIDEFKILNRCGELSIRESMSIIFNAKYVVTHDTGMMHIAAAFNKKTYSIWGGTVPEMGFSPLLKQSENSTILEVKTLSCRPCSKYGRNSCPQKHFKCMNEIDLSPVLQHPLKE